jgi:hypothetical protein
MRASHWHNALLVVDRQADQKEINTLQHYGDKSAEQNSIAAKSEIKMSHTHKRCNYFFVALHNAMAWCLLLS